MFLGGMHSIFERLIVAGFPPVSWVVVMENFFVEGFYLMSGI